mmetsp:Transcript_21745/g.53919  ORF Transcript_21745/g.53919 Transcript_21745/m.53919 type:complete len:272 (-) Transcript_21745:31-846(-)
MFVGLIRFYQQCTRRIFRLESRHTNGPLEILLRPKIVIAILKEPLPRDEYITGVLVNCVTPNKGSHKGLLVLVGDNIFGLDTTIKHAFVPRDFLNRAKDGFEPKRSVGLQNTAVKVPLLRELRADDLPVGLMVTVNVLAVGVGVEKIPFGGRLPLGFFRPQRRQIELNVSKLQLRVPGPIKVEPIGKLRGYVTNFSALVSIVKIVEIVVWLECALVDSRVGMLASIDLRQVVRYGGGEEQGFALWLFVKNPRLLLMLRFGHGCKWVRLCFL